MLKFFKYAFKVSRFRFWIYTGGTFVIGYTLGVNGISDFFDLDYIIYLFYFFFPANVLIYGVNDLWDTKTDETNPKKGTKEQKLDKNRKSNLKNILMIILVFSLILIIFQRDMIERSIFLSFLFLSYFYSAEPLRFKSTPVLDFMSNMLYIVPGIFAYYLVASEIPPLLIIVAGFAHISAMHVFSAIPDISYDKKAGIPTTAVLLKEKKSLILCLFFWLLLSGIAIFLSSFHPLSFVVLIYPLFPLLLLVNENLDIEKVYWYLPYVNTSMGGLLFVMLLLNNTNLIT
ncbi:MAG: prenyltransferase [Thermoplasmatota archaeon]